MSVERDLDESQRLVARVCGQLALCLARRRVPRGAAPAWARTLRRAADLLEKIRT